MNFGVIIIGIGHVNFLKMATNAAISLRANMPHLPITIFHSGQETGWLDARIKKMDFNYVFLPEQYYRRNGKNAFGMMKTLLYDFTPYDVTIYVDADSLGLRGANLDFFLREGGVHSFAISYGGEFNPTAADLEHRHWVKFGEIAKIFTWADETVMGWTQSSVILFNKDEKAKQIFECAYDTFLTLEKKNICQNQWFNTVPDELCFWLAHCRLGLKPTYNLINFIAFSDNLYKGKINELLEGKHIISFPSAMSLLKGYERNFYNDLISWYYSKTGVPPFFFWIDKRHAAPANFRPVFQRQNQRLRER